jgi:hypothetical protein
MPEFKNPYDAVIADLEAKRAEIDSMLESVKRFRDGFMLGFAAGSSVITADLTGIPSDAFFGMTIADAAMKFLAGWAGKKPQSTNAIIDALERGGQKRKAYPTVHSILNRRSKKQGDVVNVNGDWGLAEWYGGAKPMKPRPIPARRTPGAEPQSNDKQPVVDDQQGPEGMKALERAMGA